MMFLYDLIQELFLLFLFSSCFLVLTLKRKWGLLLTHSFREEIVFLHNLNGLAMVGLLSALTWNVLAE